MAARRLAMAAAILAASLTPVGVGASAGAAPPPAPAASAAEPDALAVQALVDAIDAAVAKLPDTATGQDVEATIAFTLDQQQQPLAVRRAALRYMAERRNAPRKLRLALLAALRAAGERSTGTAGIAAATAPLLAAGPSISGGGTGANYTPRR